jgi:hypothetical protein
MYSVSRFALGLFLGVSEEGPPRDTVNMSLYVWQWLPATDPLGGFPPLTLYLTDMGNAIGKFSVGKFLSRAGRIQKNRSMVASEGVLSKRDSDTSFARDYHYSGLRLG